MKELKPFFRGHSHQAMFFVSLGACSLLIAKSNGKDQLLATIIYSVGILLMFGISALYHRVTWNEKYNTLMKKLDHSAIYVMIAGSCTPLALILLSGESGLNLMISVWVIALVGILQSVFFPNSFKVMSLILYLLAGYAVTPYVSELLPKMGMFNIVLLVAGGVSYTIGAITYGTKKPVLNPKVFGYHEVFHGFVNLGAILHFIMIYSIIR